MLKMFSVVLAIITASSAHAVTRATLQQAFIMSKDVSVLSWGLGIGQSQTAMTAVVYPYRATPLGEMLVSGTLSLCSASCSTLVTESNSGAILAQSTATGLVIVANGRVSATGMIEATTLLRNMRDIELWSRTVHGNINIVGIPFSQTVHGTVTANIGDIPFSQTVHGNVNITNVNLTLTTNGAPLDVLVKNVNLTITTNGAPIPVTVLNSTSSTVVVVSTDSPVRVGATANGTVAMSATQFAQLFVSSSLPHAGYGLLVIPPGLSNNGTSNFHLTGGTNREGITANGISFSVMSSANNPNIVKHAATAGNQYQGPMLTMSSPYMPITGGGVYNTVQYAVQSVTPFTAGTNGEVYSGVAADVIVHNPPPATTTDYQVSVGTTATNISAVSVNGARRFWIHNPGAETLYIGGSNTRTWTGQPIAAGASLLIDDIGGEVNRFYGVYPTATVLVQVGRN